MFIYVIDGARASFGDPMPNNNETLVVLYNKSGEYLGVIAELNQYTK
jgi:hypothetical protein